MDSTLNDFFNEINKITPAKKNPKKTECVWQECFDESSGYSYYWNTTTDEVTWEMPDTYRLWKDRASKASLNLYIPPQTSSFLPNTKVQNNLKIYKISECKGLSVQRKEEALNGSKNLDCRKKEVEEEKVKPNFESKKVVLVPSYELDSDCEEDHSSSSKSPNREEGMKIEDNKFEDADSLIEDSKSSKLSKQLDNELDKKPEKNQGTLGDYIKERAEKEGFSLVAGYGNSDEDDEAEETTTSKDENKGEFRAKAIDSRQFVGKEISEDQQKFHLTAESMFYQRKKRINIEYTTTKHKTSASTGSNEYEGFGYNDSNKSLLPIKKQYVGFKSGGILFVSSDSNLEKVGGDNGETYQEENKCKSKMFENIEETSQTLSEKLRFLSEGREPTSAVQTLFIQMETLNAALKANSLNPKYLSDWLQDTCSELVKLELSAAPAGWSLQWDRANKRYFYFNRKTGENQWEYPHSNVIRSDEAMDICTTPPQPSEEVLEEPPSVPVVVSMVPPPPPTISRISSPSPPPPPYIGQNDMTNNEIAENDNEDSNVAEPLPPGVEFSEISKKKNTQSTIGVSSNNRSSTSGDLGQELNSFYSDIAALEGQINISDASSQINSLCETHHGIEGTLKRKKRKVKIAEGLSLKKKGVSKLVEKWKNVQKDLNSSN